MVNITFIFKKGVIKFPFLIPHCEKCLGDLKLEIPVPGSEM